MKEIEIHLPGVHSQRTIERLIETTCASRNLQRTAKGSLQKYAGCTHWHYQQAKTTGTLEITYWPSKNRCWFPLRDGRAKPWVVEAAKVLKAEIERQVNA